MKHTTIFQGEIARLKCSHVILLQIIFFSSKIDSITTCNMKGVAPSDEPTDNYHQTQQFPSAQWSSHNATVMSLINLV